MDLNQQSELARDMTGSELSDDQIISMVLATSTMKRNAICPSVNAMVQANNMSFEKAYPIMKTQLNKLASENGLDVAVLFWLYMDWLKDQIQY